MAEEEKKTDIFGWPLPNPMGFQIQETGRIRDSIIAIEGTFQEFLSGFSTHKHSFSDIEDLPSTLQGYGITNALTTQEVTQAIDEAETSLSQSFASALSQLSDTIATALGFRVRVDDASGFTQVQQAQGRANIDALGTPDKGKANGVASLDTSGKVPSAQLPSLTTTATVGAAVAGANGQSSIADGDSLTGVLAGTGTLVRWTWGNIVTWLRTLFYTKTEVNNVVAGTMNGRAYPRRSDGGALNFNWAGQGGTPAYVWGIGEPGTNAYPYSPSQFSVNYANSAGYAGNSGALEGNNWGSVVNYINDRAYWRTQEYLLAENIPVGGYTLARPTGNETIGIGADRNGAALYYSNTVAGSSGGQINYGTWRAVSGPITQGAAGLFKRIG